jgi:hypothetical protein
MDLPFLSLPFRALLIISEYSKPLTRPDWRTYSRLMTIEEYIYTIRYCINHNKYRINIKLLNLVFNNIAESEFYIAYNHIYFFGIDSYVSKYNLNKDEVLSNKKLNHQNDLYNIKYILNF